jgi:hypothetical protein
MRDHQSRMRLVMRIVKIPLHVMIKKPLYVIKQMEINVCTCKRLGFVEGGKVDLEVSKLMV